MTYIAYDDNAPNLVYSSGWTRTFDSYKGIYYSTTNLPGETLRFNFIGTSIKFTGPKNSTGSPYVRIKIDNVEENFSVKGTPGYDYLYYEKTGLENREHSVLLTTTTGNTWIDTIYIDNTNGFLPYRIQIDAEIIILNPSGSVPKNNNYQFDFSITPPYIISEITQIQQMTHSTLGTGTLFSASINKNKWQSISKIEVR